MASSRHCFIAFFRIPHSTLRQILHTTFRFQILYRRPSYSPEHLKTTIYEKNWGRDVKRVWDGRFEN